MTITIIVIVGGLVAIAAGLLYVANLDAREDANKAWDTYMTPRRRVRMAWNLLVTELGRPPTTAELVDALYPPEADPHTGAEGEQDGPPPPDDELEEFLNWHQDHPNAIYIGTLQPGETVTADVPTTNADAVIAAQTQREWLQNRRDNT